jgi:hypothetical protein
MNVEKLEKYKQHGQHLAVALGNVYGAKCPQMICECQHEMFCIKEKAGALGTLSQCSGMLPTRTCIKEKVSALE